MDHMLSLVAFIAAFAVPAAASLVWGVDSRIDDGRPNL